MSDIYAYAHQKYVNEMSVLTLRCPDGSIECGSRFKYLPNEITTNYHLLVKSLQEAIEKEAAENGGLYVTNDKVAPVELEKSYDFDKMKNEFGELVNRLMEKDTENAAKITAIVDRYLGKGRKVGDCTPDQCEPLELILLDMKELLGNND